MGEKMGVLFPMGQAALKPTLILLHGLLNDERVLEPVASRLRHRADAYLPNLRLQDNMAQMARDAWASVAAVPQHVPVAIAGFSMGGYVALQMLADAPRPVAALALLDTAVRPEPPANVAKREACIASLQRDLAAEVDAILRRSVHPDNAGSAALLETARQLMLDVGAPAAIRQLRAIIDRADHRAMLATLQLPTLVLCGRNDQITPLALSQASAALIPGATLAIVERAGHLSPMEQPDAVAAHLGALLDRLN